MRTNRRFIAATLSLLASGAFAACSSDALNANPNSPRLTGDAGADANTLADGGDSNMIPFEPVGPETYVPKVKNLLTGLAASDAEVAAVKADPTQLRGLIDKWMGLPQFQIRMLDFFRNAFQQNQVTLAQLQLNLGTNFSVNNSYQSRLQRNLMDSFGLTVWNMVDKGTPFTQAFTTHTYMMTTAMLSLLSYVDDNHRDDANKLTNRLAARNALTSYTWDTAATIPVTDSLDSTSPNFMKFTFPGPQPTGCATTAQTFLSTGSGSGNFYQNLFSFLMGSATINPCGITNPPGAQFTPLYNDADWSDWRAVEVDVDNTTPGASPTFYDLTNLRSASKITLHTDRMSFFGTLAFAANWGTNVTNEDRVTANQSLIVGIGQSIAGDQSTIAMFPVNATDQDHATNPACQACHVQLDPYKQFFRQSYTLWYSDQADAVQINTPAGFNIDGVNTPGSGRGVEDLGAIFASHPRMPLAWANKLVFWANSTAAEESDPELVRIANAFQSSTFDFKTLVREVFSSPLITWSAATQTTTNEGVILSIARRDQFCTALSNRLGLTDVCGQTSVTLTNQQSTIATRALLIANDTYYRTYALPSLPTNPDLFFRQSTESICNLVASQVVDASGGNSKYTSAQSDAALDDFVATVMNIPPSDPRSAPARAILADNFTASKAGGANATQALQATFSLACLSPTSVIIGL